MMKEFNLQDNELEDKIKKVLTEFIEEKEYCEKNGHEEKKDSSYIASGFGKTRAYATCKRCRAMYERGLTSEEYDDFNKIMNTPMSF